MRRGKLNNKAYLLIIVAAIFTIFSYLFDQMVINFENKNRILLINYNNLKADIKSYKSTTEQLDNLGIQMDTILAFELKKRNFNFKNIYMIENDEEFKSNFEKFAVENIKKRTIYSNQIFYADIFNRFIEYENIFKNHIFKVLNINTKKLIDEIGQPEIVFKKNLNLFYIKNYSDFEDLFLKKDANELTLDEWSDIRNYKLLYLEKGFRFNNELENIVLKIEKFIEEKELDLNIIFKERKKVNQSINYFILFGIISQILTLFFLLLLFRTLIISKII
tara:strand:- start:227 stop:1057 length:831 start_codon:yes stop_codon:yes gene_type:complete